MEELNELLLALRQQAFDLCQQRGYISCSVDINIWEGQVFYSCHATKPNTGNCPRPEGLVNWTEYVETPSDLLARLRTVLHLNPVTTPTHAD